MNIVKLLVSTLLLISLGSCSSPEAKTGKWDDFFSSVRMHYCQNARLKTQSDSLWNDVAIQMDKLLPADMDTAVRRRLIEIKNSGIIRTFKIYHTFPDTIKHKLTQVDTFDARIVRMLHANDEVLDSLERTKLKLMSEISNEQEKAEFSRVYDSSVQDPCNK